MKQHPISKESSHYVTEIKDIIDDNETLRREIRTARKAASITANLVVKQFVETEKILTRFQTVLSSASQISIIAADIEGMIIVFNTGAENLLGYKAEEVIGNYTLEIFHAASELISLSKQLSAQTGRNINASQVLFEYTLLNSPEQSEWTYIKKDGTAFPVRMSINELRNPDGTLSGFLYVAMDITEKIQSEKTLKESEERYRLLVNNLPNIVYRGYADSSFDVFDDKIEKLTGFKREEFISRKLTLFDIIIEEDLDDVKAVFRKALHARKSFSREYRMKTRQGKIVWVEEHGQIICDEAGRIDFVSGTLLDISQRKIAEKALNESEKKYRSLFVNGPNPIFVIDCETLEIFDSNPKAEETYGYKRQELIGMPFTLLDPLEKGEDATCLFRGYDDNKKIRHFKKGEKPFYVKAKTCMTTYKEKQAMILEVDDITEIMEKDAHLIQASKMTTLGEMSVGIAHELNQPLTAIKMGHKVLNLMTKELKKAKPAELKDVIDQIGSQVDRASDIINRLRSFGRKSDFSEEAKNKVDINKAIINVLSILGQQIKVQNIKLTLDLCEKLPFILAHENRIEQVIFNLLINARDAVIQKTKTGGKKEVPVISIATSQEDKTVAVVVNDNGIGIPDDMMDRIFVPFFTTKEVGQGIGLGLSIIYGIVRDYQGDITVDSRVGEGTDFKIVFPTIHHPGG